MAFKKFTLKQWKNRTRLLGFRSDNLNQFVRLVVLDSEFLFLCR